MSRTSWREYKAMAENEMNGLRNLIERFSDGQVIAEHIEGPWMRLYIEREDNSVRFIGDTWEELYYQVLKARQTVELLLGWRRDVR